MVGAHCFAPAGHDNSAAAVNTTVYTDIDKATSPITARNTPESPNTPFINPHQGRETPTNIGGDASLMWDDGL